jgi:hypothetical protein
MKRFFAMPLILVALMIVTRGYAAESDAVSSEVAPKVRQLAAFKAFFKKKGAITEDEITSQFGPPDSHTALDGSRQEPPSWWYYEIEKGEQVGIAIEDHQVILLVRRHRNKSVDVLRERASFMKP